MSSLAIYTDMRTRCCVLRMLSLYLNFGTPETGSNTEPVLFDPAASRHAKGWDKRDKEIVTMRWNKSGYDLQINSVGILIQRCGENARSSDAPLMLLK